MKSEPESRAARPDGARDRAPDRAPDRRGATLLVSIAILTLLAVFSIAFVQLVNFERAASANYVDAVRARMAAHAGVNRAIAELQRIATLKHYSDPRPGADGGDAWRFQYWKPERHPVTADRGATKGRELGLLTTITPSFAMIDPVETGGTQRELFGTPLVYSGAMAKSYEKSIDVYKLRIIDAASQLNLNHPDLPSVTRMLKNLLRCASALDDTWVDLSEAEAETIAKAVFKHRPTIGFRSLTEVQVLLVRDAGKGILGTDDKDVTSTRWTHADDDGKTTASPSSRLPLRDMLTVSSWVDETVIRPWNLNLDGKRDLPLMPRAPINLNTAAEPVLTAALAELRGTSRFGSYALGYASARELADAIRKRVTNGGTSGEGPFKTWLEFEEWLDNLTWDPQGAGDLHDTSYQDLNANGADDGEPGTVLTAGSPIVDAINGAPGLGRQGIRDLVKAALNPNTMINKWGLQPNHGGSRRANLGFPLPRLVDKSDLVLHGTEGCLDAMGIYEITSLGMVLIEDDRERALTGGMLILAEQTEQAIVRLYDVFRLTTQVDFETNRALMATGDFIEANDRKWTYSEERAPGTNRPRYGPLPLSNQVPLQVDADGNPTSGGQLGFEGWPGVTSYPVYSLHRDRQDTNYAMQAQYGPADWDGYLSLSNLLAIPVQVSDFVVCFARGYLDAFKVRVWWEPKDQEPTSGGPKVVAGQKVRPSRGHDPQAGYTDTQKLATPKGVVPVLGGVKSQERNPLDAVAFGIAAKAEDGEFFYQGSALTPHGVMIHPKRHDPDDADRPYALAYDGDNIDLMSGTSIRFWVQPTDDPFAQEEEVLFSFVGSKDGVKREIGFQVVKEYDPLLDTVAICLRSRSVDSAGGDRLSQNNWGDVPVAPATKAFGYPLGEPREVSIDVTPRGTDAVPDPKAPEWTPGSWHWIVVNFGPETEFDNIGQTASLQVDNARPSDVKQFINMGVRGPGQAGVVSYGEVHAHRGQSTFPVGNFIFGGVFGRTGTRGDAKVVNHLNNATFAWRTDRLLGDWYHCDMGGSMSTEDQDRTIQNAVVWNPNAGNGSNSNGNPNGNNGQTGAYELASSFPADVFPPGSFDRQMIVVFTDRSTNPPTEHHRANMIPANGTGMGQTGWTYNFLAADMGWDSKLNPPRGDGKGGTPDDFKIDIYCSWTIAKYDGAPCSCCSDCGTHDKERKRYHGKSTEAKNGATTQVCFMEYKGTPPQGERFPPGITHGGLPANDPFQDPDPLPLQYICDQCHGCEACDVDAPIFFGGEPLGDNYDDEGNVAAVNPKTVARAIFDNIIIKNAATRRTDSPDQPKKFEDRFFEASLSKASANKDLNFGAIYRRALLELQGFRARLGTLSWTSYPTTDRALDFTCKVFRMPGGVNNQATFKAANANALNNLLSGPAHGTEYATGWSFAKSPSFDATGDRFAPASSPYPTELLVLSVQLSTLLDPSRIPELQNPTPDDPATPDIDEHLEKLAAQTELERNRIAANEVSEDATPSNKLLSQPQLESPVFEDVTLTLILESPQILYAEEGVEE